MYVLHTYLAYLALSIAVTVWVARTLHHNGRAFLVEAFHGEEALADSVNHLLVVGFYLINLGWIVMTLRTRQELDTGRAAIELLSRQGRHGAVRAGPDALLQPVLFSRFRRRASIAARRPAARAADWIPEAAGAGAVTRLTVFYDARCGLCCAVRNWLARQPQLMPLDCRPKSARGRGERAQRVEPPRAGVGPREQGEKTHTDDDDLVVVADSGEMWTATAPGWWCSGRWRTTAIGRIVSRARCCCRPRGRCSQPFRTIADRCPAGWGCTRDRIIHGHQSHPREDPRGRARAVPRARLRRGHHARHRHPRGRRHRTRLLLLRVQGRDRPGVLSAREGRPRGRCSTAAQKDRNLGVAAAGPHRNQVQVFQAGPPVPRRPDGARGRPGQPALAVRRAVARRSANSISRSSSAR